MKAPTAPVTALPVGSVDVREVTAGPPEVGRLVLGSAHVDLGTVPSRPEPPAGGISAVTRRSGCSSRSTVTRTSRCDGGEPDPPGGVTGLQDVVDRVRDRSLARAARAGTPAGRNAPQRVSEPAHLGPLDG
ncbi:hypothetical protein JD79_03382 [Geodermatophilus normandii]|uniref:Uncharacterized protein n=1 Tax=Geodermatophilus normandii TaxID=1137989 RepID=A0A317QMN9_9ACTN|nr:hypothetical protein [Geodermatophilus normandii]PWW24204.1 hypothetical protein JD79_03382 [Geodermatophilus normandii]